MEHAFGIATLWFGLTHGIVSPDQYSHLVAVVIASAVIPTLIANARFLPRHLMPAEQATPGTVLGPVPPGTGPGASDEPLEEG